jgi:hypothetical protein
MSCDVHPHSSIHPPLVLSRSRTDAGLFPSSSSKSLQHLQAPPANPIIPPSELSYLRSLGACSNNSQVQPQAPHGQAFSLPRVRVSTTLSLSLYASDLLSMARHHPELDGTLITARAHADLATLLRARRVLHGDSTGAELIREAVAEVRTVLREVASAEMGTAAGSWEEDGLLDGGTVRADDDWFHIMSARKAKSPMLSVEQVDGDIASSIKAGSDVSRTEQEEVWEVSDKDLRKIVPRVVQHRLRVRKGPEDHVLGSVFYPAVPPPGQQRAKQDWQQRTVEEILVDILEDRDILLESAQT